jgi:hypothetical protein
MSCQGRDGQAARLLPPISRRSMAISLVFSIQVKLSVERFQDVPFRMESAVRVIAKPHQAC